MTRDRTLDLIDKLATDLVPVRPIPPLSLAVSGVLAAGIAVGIGVLTLHGGRFAEVLLDLASLLVFVGLAGVAVGGCVAGLASAVPGRSSTARKGAVFAFASMVVAIGSAAIAAPWGSPMAAAALSGTLDGHCVGVGILCSLFPVGAALAIVFRGWTPRPSVTASLTLLGTAAIGAAIVQLSCPIPDFRHVLLGHCSTPIVLAVAGVLVLTPLIRRFSR